MSRLSDCIKLCRLVAYKAQEVCRYKVHCDSIVKRVHNIEQCLFSLSRSPDAIQPKEQAALVVLHKALLDVAGVLTDCCACGPVRGLLIASSLHKRLVCSSQQLLEAEQALPLSTGPEVREVHVREVQQGDIAPEDAALQVRAARFEELVLQAEHNAAKRRQLFVEVVSLLQSKEEALPVEAGAAAADGLACKNVLPVARLKAEESDLLLPRVGADEKLMRLQRVIANAIRRQLPPQELVCPITRELFEDPVMLLDSGQTYERSAIEDWLSQGNTRDPVSGVELTSAAIIPNPLMQQAAQAWKQEHEQEKQQQGQQQRKRRKQLKAKKQALSLPVRRHDLVSTLQRHKGMPETLIAADLAAHCGYQFVKQLQDPPMFGSSRALQVHCNRTNRLRTVLQIPRAQLQQLDSSQQQQLIACLEQTSGLHHPHTLQVHEVFVTPLHLNIVLEECSAGRLTDFASKQHSTWGPAGAETATGAAGAALSPEFARWFIQQVVLAVDYCHAMQVAGVVVGHPLLKVVPNVPQPIIKVPTQLLAHGLTALTQSAGLVSPSEQQAAAGSAISQDQVKVDVYACGLLLLRLLGGQLSQQQPGGFELPSPAQDSPGLCELLSGMLQPVPERRPSVADVMANSWFKQQLPPAAANMTQRFKAKGRACSQLPDEITTVVQLACAPVGTQQHLLEQQQQEKRQRKQQQEQQQLHSGSPAGSLLLQQGLVLQLRALQQAGAQMAVLANSPAAQLFPVAFAVHLPLLLQQMALDVAEAAEQVQPQQGKHILLLQQACSDVLFKVNALLQVVHAAASQTHQQHHQHHQHQQPQLMQVLRVVSQLHSGAWEVLRAVLAARATANAIWRLSSSPNSDQSNSRDRPPSRLSAAPGAPHMAQVQLQAAQQLLAGAVLLPLLVSPAGPFSPPDRLDLEMLPFRQPKPAQRKVIGAALLWQVLAVMLQLQGRPRRAGSRCTLHASAQELFSRLEFSAEVLQPSRCVGGGVTFEATCEGQPVQVVGLPHLFAPSKQEQGAQDTAAPQQPDLSLVSPAASPEAAQQLAATLQRLQATQQQQQDCTAGSSSSSSGPVLAPIHGVCLDPPLLVLPRPAGGTLQQWISTAADSVSRTVSSSDRDFTAAWVAAMPWPLLLQLLGDVAAGVSVLHQQQPTVVHGGVHAAAVHLLQQLPDLSTAQQQQQQQQQQQVAAVAGRVCQLSLMSLLNQLAPISSCHPFLAAPETVLATGPATAAADVYGLGVLMFQLASGWLPQQYTPGTDEQIAAVCWCRDMMAQYGSTSLLAAAQQVLQAQQQQQLKGSGVDHWKPWTPYGRHMLSSAALQLLPPGYVELMEQCLHRMPPARPCVEEFIARLQEVANGSGSAPRSTSLLLSTLTAVDALHQGASRT